MGKICLISTKLGKKHGLISKKLPKNRQISTKLGKDVTKLGTNFKNTLSDLKNSGGIVTVLNKQNEIRPISQKVTKLEQISIDMEQKCVETQKMRKKPSPNSTRTQNNLINHTRCKIWNKLHQRGKHCRIQN